MKSLQLNISLFVIEESGLKQQRLCNYARGYKISLFVIEESGLKLVGGEYEETT